MESSPTFRTGNGFISSNDFRSIDLEANLVFRPNREWLTNWQYIFAVGRIWTHGGKMNLLEFDDAAFDEWINFNLYFLTKGQTGLFLSYINSQERYNGVLFPGISQGTIEIDTRISELIGGGFNLTHARSIYRDRTDPEMGKANSLDIWMDFKPTERLYIQPTFRYSRMDHLDSYLEQNPDEDKEIFDGYILRSRLAYQFTRQWFLRLVVQYNDFSERLNIEPLLTYKLNPFTKFYVGYTGTYGNFYPGDENNLTQTQWDMSSRQFFAKVQYLFRL
jgi:hypothetical protein